MPTPQRGDVWLADLGLAAKTRPVLVLSVPFSDRDYGHCSRDSEFDVDRPGDHFYTTGPNLFSQESHVCSDRVYTCQTPPRGLST